MQAADSGLKGLAGVGLTPTVVLSTGMISGCIGGPLQQPSGAADRRAQRQDAVSF